MSNNVFIFYVCKRFSKFRKLKKNPFPKASESSNSKFDVVKKKHEIFLLQKIRKCH